MIRSDVAPPTTPVLALLSDPRVTQFWDPDRVTSEAVRPGSGLGRPVWDWVAVFPAGARWEAAFPSAAFSGGDVIEVAAQVAEQLDALTRR